MGFGDDLVTRSADVHFPSLPQAESFVFREPDRQRDQQEVQPEHHADKRLKPRDVIENLRGQSHQSFSR